jgi:hypothetical protein
LDITDHKNFIFLRKLQPFYQKIRDHGITSPTQSNSP